MNAREALEQSVSNRIRIEELNFKALQEEVEKLIEASVRVGYTNCCIHPHHVSTTLVRDALRNDSSVDEIICIYRNLGYSAYKNTDGISISICWVKG